MLAGVRVVLYWQENPTKFKSLASSFASLQKIILEGKVATDYDYHGVAAPWIQIKILKILGLLGADNEKWVNKKLQWSLSNHRHPKLPLRDRMEFAFCSTRESVSRYRLSLRRSHVWEIKYCDLRALNIDKFNIFFYKLNKEDLPVMFSCVSGVNLFI